MAYCRILWSITRRSIERKIWENVHYLARYYYILIILLSFLADIRATFSWIYCTKISNDKCCIWEDIELQRWPDPRLFQDEKAKFKRIITQLSWMRLHLDLSILKWLGHCTSVAVIFFLQSFILSTFLQSPLIALEIWKITITIPFHELYCIHFLFRLM